MDKQQKKPKYEIDRDSLIAEIVERYPDAIDVLSGEYGFYCIGCPLAFSETLGEGAQVHGLTEEETDELIEKLRKL